MKIFWNKLRFGLSILIALILRFCSIIIPKKNHWVIMERGKDARDNAYFFYEYIKKNHPQKKVYYVINKNSSDYFKVKDDAIQPYSLNYYWLVSTCEKYISTHNNDIVRGLYKYRKLTGVYKKYCFLQHGVIYNFIPSLCSENFSPLIFICGAKPEYDYILDKFGHSPENVKYTGLARFDNLHNVSLKRQILVMPTWRQNYNAEFEKSDYYKNWNGLLNSKELAELLENNNIDLVFYPHFEVQKYINLFSSGSKNIIIASFKDYDVQTLLKESAVLITDFSSVYFDFAYMKKPIIYFQFDREHFFKTHYQIGYFDYETMGFGKVCKFLDEIVNEVDRILRNGFKLDDEFLKRVEGFFPIHDINNCERIYKVITNTK